MCFGGVDVGSLLYSIILKLPLENVQHLMVGEFIRSTGYQSETSSLSERLWCRIFAEASNIQTLAVAGSSAECLPAALKSCPDDQTMQLSKLRHLKLDSVSFLTGISVSDGQETEEKREFRQRGECFEALLTMLRHRASLGHRIEKLIVTRANSITEMEVFELAKWVDDLVWDGRTGQDKTATARD